MVVCVGVAAETAPGQRRFTLVPEVAKGLMGLRVQWLLQSGAGAPAHSRDERFADINFAPDAAEVCRMADVMPCVQPPSAERIAAMRPGAVLLGMLHAERAQQLLEEGGVEVVFAIHPVAGHMNVLLAEGGMPHDKILDFGEISANFAQADVALVIGANDVVNPVARTDKSNPIYGMPILNVHMAHNFIVVKRGRGAGCSGIENVLFFKDNCSMLYGRA